MVARRIGRRWSDGDELELELFSVAMASSGRERTEGLLWCLIEERRGRG
jgi:hypothetical protein